MENEDKLKPAEFLLVAGMGGSALAAELIKSWRPHLKIGIHKDYGLPPLGEEVLRESLVILSSYSGETEEVLDVFEEARQKQLNMAVVSAGGRLLDLAQKHGTVYIKIPEKAIRPRMSLGFAVMAHIKLLGETAALEELSQLSDSLSAGDYEVKGKELAKKLGGGVPVIYASVVNQAVAYNWKIRFNETSKTPAFFNVFPELNHNEMAGFDLRKSTLGLGENFHFIFLRDGDDDKRILKRMRLTKKLYEERGFKVEMLDLEGRNRWERIFSSLLIADWTAYYLADGYGQDPLEEVTIEAFKRAMRQP